MELTNAIAIGYVDPALEGHVITFTCLQGHTLNGCSQSTCMGNGKWEPDPRDMECIGEWFAWSLFQFWCVMIWWSSTSWYRTEYTGNCSLSDKRYNIRYTSMVKRATYFHHADLCLLKTCLFIFISSMQQSILCTSDNWPMECIFL